MIQHAEGQDVLTSNFFFFQSLWILIGNFTGDPLHNLTELHTT